MTTFLILSSDPTATPISASPRRDGVRAIRVTQMLDVLAALYAEDPDLLLVGADVERADGLGLIQALRRTAEWDHLPVLLLATDTEVARPVAESAYLVPASWSLESMVEQTKCPTTRTPKNDWGLGET